MDAVKSCTRCVFDETVPNIKFDADGVCNFCHLFDRMEKRYPIDENKLQELVKRMQLDGRKREYDCLVPWSGGMDSTYVLYMVKKLGLRPLAVHFDNSWVSPVARNNMQSAMARLGTPLKQISLDWTKHKELYAASLKASVPEVCLPCEVIMLSQLLDYAARERIPYLIFGNSFRREGIAPLRWHYIDGKYFDDVMAKFSKKKVKNLNKMHASDMFYYNVIKGIKMIQLPLYVAWDEKTIEKTLTEECGWVNGGEHHFDCRYHPVREYVINKKFKIDNRKIQYSALINSGQMTRAEAVRLLKEPVVRQTKEEMRPLIEELGISMEEFDRALALEPKTFMDYSTYYSAIRRCGPVIKLLCRLHLFPETLYEKFFECG